LHIIKRINELKIEIKSVLFTILLLAACIFSYVSVYGQTSDKEWTPVAFDDNLTYVDLTNINSFQGEDLYVWISEKHSTPVSIEGLKKDIYTTHTYYLINKELKRYSLMEILYFDKKDNVIKNFSYKVSDSKLPDMKYNYPIMEGSLMEMILQRCQIEIERPNEEVQ